MNFPDESNADDLPLIEPSLDATYTIDVVAELTGVSSQTVLFYHEQGLVPTLGAGPPGERYFDDEALRVIRKLEHLRSELQLKEPALKLMVTLLSEIEQLRNEARARR
ncbi:MAG: chaperone modulator CbpM [Opitutaceae bacterium]